jgi:hypothetical protein
MLFLLMTLSNLTKKPTVNGLVFELIANACGKLVAQLVGII